jgi:hypothetical protein
MAGSYLKGALVEFVETFMLPVPNVIIFQYNPETLTHAWTQPAAAPPDQEGFSNPLAVKGSPGETFQFTIAMDANDMISDGGPVEAALATTTGIYSRLAALEMLQYPVAPSSTDGLLGTVSAGVSASDATLSGSGTAGSSTKVSVPLGQIPTVLFIWGPGRIVPVRVNSLSITEKLYDVLLNPIHAEATLGLRVLTPEELLFIPGTQGKIATAAYTYTLTLRKALAVANLANASDSILGMLPV